MSGDSIHIIIQKLFNPIREHKDFQSKLDHSKSWGRAVTNDICTNSPMFKIFSLRSQFCDLIKDSQRQNRDCGPGCKPLRS